MPNTITFVAEETANLDTTCFRGSAPLNELARVSMADVFDQETNPEGLQRDLSKRHAIQAYDYVARERNDEYPRAFPEVVLNVRDKSVVKVERLATPAGTPIRLVKLTVDLDKLERARSVKISRVDGNHRLMYANGDDKDRAALTAQAPFQLHVGLTREQEAQLFLDINAEQKGLNTSHLDYLRSRLTPDEVELAQHKQRIFARRLASDAGSPWHNLVFLGGSREGLKEKGEARPVSFTALEGAVRRILRKSQFIELDVAGSDAQYQLVRSYWSAVAATWPEAFESPADYLAIKGVGLAALGQLGAAVIDRCTAAGEVEQADMEVLLAAVKDVVDFDKTKTPNEGGIAGMSGNRAALIIAGELMKKLPKDPRAARSGKQAVAA